MKLNHAVYYIYLFECKITAAVMVDDLLLLMQCVTMILGHFAAGYFVAQKFRLTETLPPRIFVAGKFHGVKMSHGRNIFGGGIFADQNFAAHRLNFYQICFLNPTRTSPSDMVK